MFDMTSSGKLSHADVIVNLVIKF